MSVISVIVIAIIAIILLLVNIPNKVKFFVFLTCGILGLLIVCTNKHKSGGNGNIGEVSLNQYKYLFDDLKLPISAYLNESGVFNVKQNYKNNFDGEKLFDLIFNYHNPDISKLSKNNLYKIWYQGNTNDEVNKSVTAGIKGLHIYITGNKEIVGIVLRK